MQSGSREGGVGGKYNSVVFVELCEIFVTQDDLFQYNGTI